MVTQVFRTVAGDFNVDGRVDGADYVVWRNSGSLAGGALYTQGDADFDGDVDGVDLAAWRSEFGFVRQPLSPGSASGAVVAAVPEPISLSLVLLTSTVLVMVRRKARGICTVAGQNIVIDG